MTYYISVSTTNGKTVIEGTLAEFNQVTCSSTMSIRKHNVV